MIVCVCVVIQTLLWERNSLFHNWLCSMPLHEEVPSLLWKTSVLLVLWPYKTSTPQLDRSSLKDWLEEKRDNSAGTRITVAQIWIILNYRPVDWHLPVYDNKLQPWQVHDQQIKVCIVLNSENSVTLSPPSPILDSLALDPHYLLFFCCQLA